MSIVIIQPALLGLSLRSSGNFVRFSLFYHIYLIQGTVFPKFFLRRGNSPSCLIVDKHMGSLGNQERLHPSNHLIFTQVHSMVFTENIRLVALKENTASSWM